jgi:hypothetical protein
LNVQVLPACVAAAVALIASYWDLFRGRIIPDKLTIPSIFSGVVFYVILGLLKRDFLTSLYGGLGALFSFSLAYLLWLTGGWAGGDVKLFTAFGAWLPVYSPPLSKPLFGDYPLFPLSILFNSALLSLPVILVFTLVRKLQGKGAFYEEVKITELEEGAIPAELIYLKDGEVRRERAPLFLREKWDKLLAHPRRASGLSEEQVRELKRLVSKGKLENKMRVKRGIPFGPFLALGLLVGLLFGDLYSFLLGWLVGGMS